MRHGEPCTVAGRPDMHAQLDSMQGEHVAITALSAFNSTPYSLCPHDSPDPPAAASF